MADRYVLVKRIGLAVGALTLVGCAVIVYLCCFSNPPITVIVLRHAEKDTTSNPQNDAEDDVVPLSPDGTARAETLADVLGESGVSAIYVTQKLRTQRTAEPLATRRAITPLRYTYGDDDDINDLVERVLSGKNRGRVVVIVGHSDSVPTIVHKLSGRTVTVGNEFDNLFVLRVNSLTRTGQIIKATYGAPR
jgi:phosphohistidine phosphatase SixA